MTEIPVSIIVPTRNSAQTLERCLKKIRDQTYKNIEIIVVDNYSTDDTINIARRFTNKIFTIGPERSAQVNYGVQMSSGKYIYRVDSDFLLDSNVVNEAVAASETNNYAAILIHNTSDPTISFWSRVRKFERDMYATDSLHVAVRFVRRDVFLSIGGFDSSLVAGEDYDLHNRIVRQYNIGRISSCEIHLGEPKTLIEIAKKHYYYGKTINKFLQKNKERGVRQFSPIRIAYIRHYKEFIKHPILSIGFILYQAVRYSSGLLGILSSKYNRLVQDGGEIK